MSETIAKRIPPDPLPIEPYFRGIAGCEGFLQAIAEEPDDDLNRLVFADWLEDHGHSARAEFIRVQLDLHNGVGIPYESPATTRRTGESSFRLSPISLLCNRTGMVTVRRPSTRR